MKFLTAILITCAATLALLHSVYGGRLPGPKPTANTNGTQTTNDQVNQSDVIEDSLLNPVDPVEAVVAVDPVAADAKPSKASPAPLVAASETETVLHDEFVELSANPYPSPFEAFDDMAVPILGP